MSKQSELCTLTIASAKEKLLKGEITSVELTEAHLKQMDAQKHLNAFITPTPELALQQAKESDKRYQKNEAKLLDGMPIGVKDLFCTKDTRTTAGSHILENFVPPYESGVTSKLWSNGALMVGKTNMDEFAMGSANITSYFGSVKNPWRKKGSNTPENLVPGGSSGGSAAAVAGNMCLASLGSDTGGSIRQPAAFCGLVGLLPTYGRCSRYGMVAFASSLDQAGPLTKTVEDAALLFQGIAGFDPKDSTSADVPLPNFQKALTGNIKGMRIGIPKEYRLDGMPQRIEKLWQEGIDWLKDAGAEIVDVSLPHTKYALPCYYIIAPAEASSNLARYDGVRFGHRAEGKTLNEMYAKTRGEGFGREVKRRILIGTYVLSSGYYDAYYVKALRIRKLIRDDFMKVYEKVDALLTPSTPNPAFEIGQKMDDPLSMYLNDAFTVTVNLAGLPGLSIPAGFTDDELPLGLQIIGKPFDEGTILNIGSVIEKSSGFLEKARLIRGN
ncbi:MAG: Asp-tRNA(Asn)/Glu-tRNA(Gln) amidotransferase subunit GatA [Alphaproteobacteria bacterium]|nr:Asp-tRNA(Asn)/Glu-tRNA(Gln) amidotransferase subunit GatA [Alphaproteobacteria bacterium]